MPRTRPGMQLRPSIRNIFITYSLLELRPACWSFAAYELQSRLGGWILLVCGGLQKNPHRAYCQTTHLECQRDVIALSPEEASSYEWPLVPKRTQLLIVKQFARYLRSRPQGNKCFFSVLHSKGSMRAWFACTPLKTRRDRF